MPTVKYFGILAETLAKAEEEISMDQSNLYEFVEQIKESRSLQNYDFQVAVNRKLVSDLQDIVLKDSDEIAFLPAFAGG